MRVKTLKSCIHKRTNLVCAYAASETIQAANEERDSDRIRGVVTTWIRARWQSLPQSTPLILGGGGGPDISEDLVFPGARATWGQRCFRVTGWSHRLTQEH